MQKSNAFISNTLAVETIPEQTNLRAKRVSCGERVNRNAQETIRSFISSPEYVTELKHVNDFFVWLVRFVCNKKKGKTNHCNDIHYTHSSA